MSPGRGDAQREQKMAFPSFYCPTAAAALSKVSKSVFTPSEGGSAPLRNSELQKSLFEQLLILIGADS